MLIPYTYIINIKDKDENGLTVAKEKTVVYYYKSNNNPYLGCKSCRKEKETDKDRIVNPRRHGSAYCEEHAGLHKQNVV